MGEFVCCEDAQLPHGVYLVNNWGGALVAKCANCDFVSAYWDCVECELSHACETEAECPNHAGSYDCTPFCELCQGSQMVPVLVGKG